MTFRHSEYLFLLAFAAMLLYGASLLPSAMDAQIEHNREVALSRCIVGGDFDDSTEYCRAVAKEAGQ